MKQLTTIWAALVGGVLLYTAVIGGLLAAGSLDAGNMDPALMNYVGAGVIVYMAVAVFARRTMVAQIPSAASPEERFRQYRVLTIVALALMETGGLVVVTFGMLAGSATWVVAGGAAAAGTMFMARPMEDEISLD